MSILISKKGEEAKWVESSSFTKEEDLQKYIENNPHSIPLSNYKEDTELLIICREFQTTHGEYIDHVGVDKDGEIYLIETKLYKNSDKRHVVSQVLDYGATLASDYSSFDEFLSNVEQWISENYKSTLKEKLEEHFGLNSHESEELIQKIENVYTAKKFVFIILMDKADSKIKNYVSFMNDNSKFSIFLVEFKRYVDGDREIIIPSLFGTENVKRTTSSRGWNKEDFDNTFNKNPNFDDNTRNAIEKLITFTEMAMPSDWKGYWHEYFGGSGSSPIFQGYLPKVHETRSLFDISSESGSLHIKFWALVGKPDLLENFVQKCGENGFEIVKTQFHERGPGSSLYLKINDWVPKVDKFISILREIF